jgi:hypothetical protein
MIDKSARKQIASLFYRFRIGEISGNEYYKQLKKIPRREKKLYALFFKPAEKYYQHIYRGLEGELTTAERETLNRIIAFLHSDQAFLWPIVPPIALNGALATPYQWQDISFRPRALLGAIVLSFLGDGLITWMVDSDIPLLQHMLTIVVIFVTVVIADFIEQVFEVIKSQRDDKKVRAFIEQTDADPTAWPFFTQADYRQALDSPSDSIIQTEQSVVTTNGIG